ncbi:hypothetical protein MB02_14240 [Croceicoccus estronivorus]|uniref:tetratricopeptide repeat protein n=1 Tax=Croceicoccus estronivorus TaxID=1172626 RepID=UPI00082F6F60|nr:tetratricopeptide repeat protein [Croceicoccus estronivorus]OCC22922.1 hypothetical protein MB02_14240 [Croceicoccus estronivorus]
MTQDTEHDRLRRLRGFLEQDPENPALLRDVAALAMTLNDPQQAMDCLAELERTGAAEIGDRNLMGIAAMHAGQPEQAVRIFSDLRDTAPLDLGLRFNLAWALALAQDFAAARALLDDDLTDSLPQAALLEVQLMHDAGEFDAAILKARAHVARHPDYPPLLAAVSVLALDVEDEDLARQCAEKGGDQPDALTTLGMLTLGGADTDHAAAQGMFERALAFDADSPRARIGLGLSLLAAGNGAMAATELDKGAERFGDHLGSWIAAGWAYLVAGDMARARERFDHALQLDPNFAESHGSLAVLDMLSGDREQGDRRLEIAQRLDRASFSAAFAKMLMASSDGDSDAAERILDIALKQPLDGSGRTIGAALARAMRSGG